MFFNATAKAFDHTLFLDIDSKKEIVKNFVFEGAKAELYSAEINELKELVLGKSFDEIKHLDRKKLKSETLINGKKPMMPIGLYLLREAISSYMGVERTYKEQKDLLCLCFSITKKDIEKRVLEDKTYELKSLIAETMASSACGSCRKPIEALIIKTRLENGLIKGLDHSRSRFDEKGEWLKIAGMYPGPLLIEIDSLKTQWMKREDINDQFKIELINLEGHHLSMSIKATNNTQDNEKTYNALSLALSEYLKKELGALFFIELVQTQPLS
jgi:bacterioferritin-associated ferredoxin